MVKKNIQNLDDIIDVVKKLRDPKKGCPWDIQQNAKSLAKYTLEEAYEVVEAIESGNYNELEDELGDLLLQVIYHSVIAEEKKKFNIKNVISKSVKKMKSRHPHIFLKNENIKSIEDVRSLKLQKRAAKEGFDWENALDTLKKVKEEVREVSKEIQVNNKKKIKEELGDLFFSCINLSRKLGLDVESVIRDSNRKFEKRFKKMEKNMNKNKLDWNLKNFDKEWQKSK